MGRPAGGATGRVLRRSHRRHVDLGHLERRVDHRSDTEQEWASGYDRWLERVHPDDRDRVVASNRRFLESSSRSPQSDEYRVVLPDGRVRWIHERALLLADADSGELLVHGVLVDVTEERTSLEVAERVGGLFRTLIEHSREAVTIVDENGVVLYQNPSMGRVVGRPPEWFEGKTPLDLMPPEDAARGREILAQLRDKPRLPSCRASSGLKHRDGSWRVVEGVATNLLHDPAVARHHPELPGRHRRARAGAALRDVEQRRQTLLEDIINAEAQQRSRIAEELHDDTIQVMAAALMELDRIDRHLRRSDVDAARDAITSARERAHQGDGSHSSAHVRAASAAPRGGRPRPPPSAISPMPCAATPAPT